jgi:hypothetical protein
MLLYYVMYTYLDQPPVPIEPELAPYVHAGGIHGYEEVIEAHVDAWAERYVLALRQANVAAVILAQAMGQSLAIPYDSFDRATDRATKERDRLRVLYALAMSHLVEDTLLADPEGDTPPAVIEDGIGHQMLTIGLDMLSNESTWPFEVRLHATRTLADRVTAPLPAGAPHGWYCNADKGVYLRRTRTTVASPPYPEFLANKGIKDLCEVTIFPYMAARKP